MKFLTFVFQQFRSFNLRVQEKRKGRFLGFALNFLNSIKKDKKMEYSFLTWTYEVASISICPTYLTLRNSEVCLVLLQKSKKRKGLAPLRTFKRGAGPAIVERFLVNPNGSSLIFHNTGLYSCSSETLHQTTWICVPVRSRLKICFAIGISNEDLEPVLTGR